MMKEVKKCFCVIFALTIILFTASNVSGENVLIGNKLSGWTEQKNKGSLILTVRKGDDEENAQRILRPTLDGDWYIDSHLVTSSAPDGDNHVGIVLYKDPNNWLLWGQRNNSFMEFSGKVDGNIVVPVQASYHVYPHMRMIKRTGDSNHTRYYVYGCDNYAGDDSHEFWQYCGYYEDTNGVFDSGAEYGLYGRDSASGSTPGGYAANFDYFNDLVPKIWTDSFYSLTLDGRWNFHNSAGDASYYCDGNDLVLNVTLNDDQWTNVDKAPRILTKPMNQDWIIETGIDYNDSAIGSNSDTGLVVFSDTQNWIMFGQKANNCMNVGGLIGNIPINVGTVESVYKFIRITKTGNSYNFKCSDTGYSWTDVGTFIDSNDDLNGAQYGFMGKEWGTNDYTVKFDFFREWPRPTGAIKEIDQITQICQLTGEASVNQTESNWGIGSCDLGSFAELNGEMYQFFGDTFSGNDQTGAWYNNSMAKLSTPNNFSNGLTYSKMTKQLISPRNDDMSMIPTYAIGVNDTLYMYIMEIRAWGAPGHWDCNGGAWATSTDEGQTWSLHEPIFDGDSHFKSISIIQSGSDLYIWGTTGGGFGSVKLAKVKANNILDKSSYLFCTGGDNWSSSEDDAVDVVPAPNREIGVTYNAYLDKYLLTTLDNVSYDMVIKEASNPWGPWSDPILLYGRQYVNTVNGTDVEGMYGAYTLPCFMDNNGETMYITLNLWYIYNPFWYKIHFVKN